MWGVSPCDRLVDLPGMGVSPCMWELVNLHCFLNLYKDKALTHACGVSVHASGVVVHVCGVLVHVFIS